MDFLPSNRIDALETYTGACNTEAGEYAISAEDPFTYEDIAAIQDYYYNGGGLRQIHMNDVPGEICWRNKGETENRKLADAVGETCADVLGGGAAAENKCEELYNIIERHSDQPWYEDAARYAGYAAAGLAGTWAVFGPGMTLWYKIQIALTKSGGHPEMMVIELLWPQELRDEASSSSPVHRYDAGYNNGPI